MPRGKRSKESIQKALATRAANKAQRALFGQPTPQTMRRNVDEVALARELVALVGRILR